MSDLACNCLLSIIRTVYISYNEVTAAIANLLSLSVMVALAVLAIITTPGSVVVSNAEKVSCSS